MKKIIYFSLILVLTAAAFFSCDVALGEKVNIFAPKVNIEKPLFLENISEEFYIEGTASEDKEASGRKEIVHIYVTVEKVTKFGGREWKIEYHGEKGSWTKRIDGNSLWASTNEGTWKEENGPGSIRWSLTITTEGMEDGEYIITASAENSVYTKGPQEQRRVIVDKFPPTVLVLSPDLPHEYSLVKDEFDGYALRDPSVMDKLFNQDLKIQYEIKDEEFSIKTIQFFLSDTNSNVILEGKELVYPEDASWGGKFEFDGLQILDRVKRFMGDGPSYHLCLTSIASDEAGNQKEDHHGYFVYWPESDIPWATGIGYDSYTAASAANADTVYPESQMQLLSYDDDGISIVLYQLFLANSDGSKGAQITPIIAMEKNPSATFFSFPIKAPQAPAMYLISIRCIDIYNTQSEEIIRYFSVPEYLPPDIQITNPDKDVSLFGTGANGTFNISGTVSAGAFASKLYVAWIKPGHPETQFEYQSADAAVWNLTGSGPWSPANAKIWELSLHPGPIEGAKFTSTFSRDLNLFSDIGINESDVPLVTQTFVFMAVGSTGTKVTKLLSVRGDITPPSLSFTNLTISRAGSVIPSGNIPASNFDNPNFNMPKLETGDLITINGTWDDDSFAEWGGANNAAIRRKEFTVTWNNNNLTNAALSSNRTWSASTTLDDNQAAMGGGRIEVKFIDLGKNIATASLSAKADSNIPVLMNISSEDPDRSYRSGETINIYLEFNKAVRHTGTAPTLTLREKGMITGTSATANYAANNDNTNGSTKHYFTYTVANNQNFEILNVSAINTTANNWEDVSTAGQRPNVAVPSGRSLGDTKRLRIDTINPTILNVQALVDESPAYYRQGQTIYITMTFSEDINFTPGSPSNNTSLALNIGSGGGAGRVPMLMGSNQLLFTYHVQANDNTPVSPLTYLTANSLSLGNGTITDLAGNLLSVLTIPSGSNINNTKNIVVDTLKPVPPTLTSSLPSGTVTSSKPETFSITSTETDSILEYSIKVENNEDGPWLTYRNLPDVNNTSVEISSTAKYNIRARQTDRAGNESDPTAYLPIEILRSEVLLQSLGGSNPGTYKTGDVIDIKINLNMTSRGALGVTGIPSLTLNVANGANTTKNVNWNTSGGIEDGKTLVFKYTVTAGDSVDTLEIVSINLPAGVDVTGNGNSLKQELLADWNKEGRQPLSFYTRISVRTDIPIIQSAIMDSADPTKLRITFSKDVYKGSGNIVITQPTTGVDNAYRAPAVMSRADYFLWGGDTVLGSYYDAGTNGTDNAGNPDLTEKYILKWEVEPTAAALVTALTGRGAHRVTIPVASGAVTISGNIMTVDLSQDWGYNLRVKGVTYDLSIANTIVRDGQSNNLSGTYTGTLANPGTNDPFIRVQKNRGTFSSANVTLPADGGNQTTTYWVNLNDAATQISQTTTAPTTGTWIQVNQYQYSGTFTSQSTAPTTAQDPTKWYNAGSTTTNYWIKNAALTFSAAAPGTAGTWASVAQFYTSFPINAPGVTVGATSGAYLAAGTGTAATYRLDANDINTGGRGQVRGNGYRNANSTSFLISDYLGDNAWTIVNMNFWVNPYETTNTIGGRYNQGDVVVNNNVLWANVDSIANKTTDMVPASNPPANTNAGWLRVGITETAYIDLRTVRWATTGGTNITPRYWIRTDVTNPTRTETNMSGTAGWVSYNETVAVGGTSVATTVTTQPRQAQVRIDSQTPSAEIRYRTAQSERTEETGTNANRFNGTTHPSLPAITIPAAPANDLHVNGITFSVGDTNTYNGITAVVRAYAVRTPVTTATTSGTVYEKAARSVIRYNFGTNVPNNWVGLRNNAGTGRVLQLWIRGGTETTGENSIKGFPLSWSETDRSGARLMTNVGTVAAPDWFWMTWEVTDKAYFYFIAGTTSNTLNDIRDNGPLSWAWGKNAWAVQQAQYPLYSGGSLLFTVGTVVAQPATATFEFYDNFSGSRTP